MFVIAYSGPPRRLPQGENQSCRIGSQGCQSNCNDGNDYFHFYYNIYFFLFMTGDYSNVGENSRVLMKTSFHSAIFTVGYLLLIGNSFKERKGKWLRKGSVVGEATEFFSKKIGCIEKGQL